ncbi:4-alpha-glucanotransferase [Zhongshania sp. BJYM1]|uniref:4-alpha-glucanotransferase n=1 Tax=Zhongshania aquatica TaxID=2965069 RepID=UPI0022B48065|nr:4-alpha-glucanotransferase [Marortus sp. BJYM1]
MDSLEKLLYLSGVAAEYDNYSGQRCIVPQADRLQLLRLAEHDIDSPQAVSDEIFELDARRWQQRLDAFYITQAEALVTIYCHPDDLDKTLSWQLVDEDGGVKNGAVVPADLAETGNYYIDGIRYTSRSLALGLCSFGYLQLRITVGDAQASAQVAVCPDRCFDVETDGKFWGIACQLYSLRSERNWGIGDFADLRELISAAAAKGADLIGINPLHALRTDGTEDVSPYSPSDRRFLNPGYLAVEEIPECIDAESIVQYLRTPLFQQRTTALRAVDMVNHSAVLQIKYQVLELAYSYFLQHHEALGTERGREFSKFVQEGGDALRQFSDYECRHNGYAVRHRQDITFFSYLQWLASEQLASCQVHARDVGMRIGIMGDLAVGSVAGGCETAENAELYVTAVSIGAPPDPFSSEGQDWGLPVMNPVAMQRNHFQHFISLLRANMALGALRIDHVMSLQRLWWCLPREPGEASRGVYVYYPTQVLLPLLCLESHRHRCVIVGEDLGVVPADIRELMLRSGVYGNDLFYFTQHHDGQFWMPSERRRDALLSVTNHDVPTLSDWWSEDDLQRRYQLGVIPDQASLDALYLERKRDKRYLLQWLESNQLMPSNWEVEELSKPMDMALCESIHRGCGRSASRFMLLQLEDLQLLKLPINIPATSHQYPNWRRKQALTTREIFAGVEATHLLNGVDKERTQ